MTDAKTLETYAKMATDYADLASVDSTRDPVFDSFLEGLPKGGHVFDLGCGPGHYAADMAKAGFRVTATDAVPEMVALAGAYPGVNAKCATFDDIEGQAIYDGVWANFCLLHAPRADMPRYLKALHAVLKSGGLFHIALKSGEGSKRDGIDRLYTYYTLHELQDLLTAAGFSVTEHSTGNSVGLDGVRADWIAVHAHA